LNISTLKKQLATP